MSIDVKIDQERYIETWRNMAMAAMEKCAMLEGAIATMQKQAEGQTAALAERENRIASLVATVASMSESSQPPAAAESADPLGR